MGRDALRGHSTLTTAWCEGGEGRGDGVGRCGGSQGEGHWEQAQNQPAPIGREACVLYSIGAEGGRGKLTY